MKVLILISMIVYSAFGDIQLLTDLSPDEAYNLLISQKPTLEFAPLVGQSKTVDNLDEKIYQASQLHGQDGVGNYLFAYNDWNQAHTESRNGATGRIAGMYRYINPNNEDIRVNYIADEKGFRQTDNRPKERAPEPVTDTPEVKKARKFHADAWRKAAESGHRDPLSDIYNRNAIESDRKLREHDIRMKRLVSRLETIPQEYLDSFTSSNKGRRVSSRRVKRAINSQTELPAIDNVPNQLKEGETGIPTGFYYAFDYPVYVTDLLA